MFTHSSTVCHMHNLMQPTATTHTHVTSFPAVPRTHNHSTTHSTNSSKAHTDTHAVKRTCATSAIGNVGPLGKSDPTQLYHRVSHAQPSRNQPQPIVHMSYRCHTLLSTHHPAIVDLRTDFPHRSQPFVRRTTNNIQHKRITHSKQHTYAVNPTRDVPVTTRKVGPSGVKSISTSTSCSRTKTQPHATSHNRSCTCHIVTTSSAINTSSCNRRLTHTSSRNATVHVKKSIECYTSIQLTVAATAAAAAAAACFAFASSAMARCQSSS
jgi:hypothetical protein